MSNSSSLKDKHAGNTKPREVRSRKYTITLNNFTEEEYLSFYEICENKKWDYIIGKEVGKEGTPHLQIFIESKNPITFSSLKKINNRFHIEVAQGTKEQNFKYCSKDKNYVSNMGFDKLTRKEKLLLKYENVEWKEWQKQIIEIIETEPDDRTINWIIDEKGNNGKSFLCKYLYLKYNCVIADGKKDNVFNQIKYWLDENEDDDLKLVLLDIPRSKADYIDCIYGTLEKIKDGLIYSGKYEGGVCCFESPHIFVFSNNKPELEKFSEDRWNIIKI